MTLGKCFIYKRATLFSSDQPPKLIDYSSGLKPFDCNLALGKFEYPVYEWHLVNQVIPIPLNVPRHQVDSIMKKGTLNGPDGDYIEWEFIFGKFIPLPQYMLEQLIKCLPFLIVIMYLYNRQRS